MTVDEVLFSICAILHAQIQEDLSKQLETEESKNSFDFPLQIIDPDIPTIDQMYRDLKKIAEQAKYSPELNIFALIYIIRLTEQPNIAITSSNFQTVWTSCLIIALEVMENRLSSDLENAFHKILGISMEAIQNWKQLIILRLNDKVSVRLKLFTKFCLEIKQFYKQLTKSI